MKYLITILFLFFNFANSYAQWQLVTNDKFDFSFSLPSDYLVQTDTTKAAIGSIISVVYDGTLGRDSYTLNCSVFPDNYLEQNGATILENGPTGFAEGVNGKIISQEKLKKQDLNGIRYIVDVKQNIYIYNQVFIVDNKLFQLSVSKWELTDFTDDSLSKFFTSFEI